MLSCQDLKKKKLCKFIVVLKAARKFLCLLTLFINFSYSLAPYSLNTVWFDNYDKLSVKFGYEWQTTWSQLVHRGG